MKRCSIRGVFALACLAFATSAVATTFDNGTMLPYEQNANLTMDVTSAGAADANGDGRTDVLLLEFNSTTWNIVPADLQFYLYEQQADGTMPIARRFDGATPDGLVYNPQGMGFGDLDNDGRAEIVLRRADNTMAILVRTPTGPYREAVKFPYVFKGSRLFQTMIRDIDGDGRPDMLLDTGGAGVAIYRGRGDLTFEAPVYRPAFSENSLEVVHLDGDGRLDMVGVNHGTSLVGVAWGTATGGPVGETWNAYVPDDFPLVATAGVFGGLRSLVVAEESKVPLGPNTIDYGFKIRLMQRLGDGTFAEHASVRESLQGLAGFYNLKAVDLDADGDDDLVAFTSSAPRVLLQESGVLQPAQPYPHIVSSNDQPRPGNAHVADFNGDGCLDLGYAARAYIIHLRTDCPTRNPNAAIAKTGTVKTPTIRKPVVTKPANTKSAAPKPVKRERSNSRFGSNED